MNFDGAVNYILREQNNFVALPPNAPPELKTLWNKLQQARDTGTVDDYTQAVKAYDGKLTQLYPQGTNDQGQPMSSSTNNMAQAMQQKYKGKTWDDIRKDPNATPEEKEYATQQRLARDAGLTPQQRNMERTMGYGSASNMQAVSQQQKQSYADPVNNKYEQWKKDFANRYPGTDFTASDNAMKKMVDDFNNATISTKDASALNPLAKSLQDNMNKLIAHNEYQFQQPGHYFPPVQQQSNDPFQARINQMNQANQQWAANPGIQQVGGSNPFTSAAQQSQPQQQSYTAGYMGAPAQQPIGYATKSNAPQAIDQYAKTGKFGQQPVMTAKKYY